MKPRLYPTASLAMLLLCFLIVPLHAQEYLKPSEALDEAKKIVMEQYHQYREARKTNPDLTFDDKGIMVSVAGKMLKKVQTEDLSSEEQFSLAQLHNFAGQHENALTLLGSLAAGNGVIAQRASALRLKFLLDEKKYEGMGALIAEHQRRYAYTAENQGVLVSVLGAYARILAQEGKHPAVVDLIVREINRLPDPPERIYSAPHLAAQFISSFAAVGRRDEAIAIMEKYLSAYEKLCEAQTADTARGESRETQEAKAIAMEVQILGAQLTQAKLIGTAAPPIEFSRVFNAPDDLTFADLKGKVVLIDYWTNWCGPCKAAFPTLRKLYDEYRDKGFVVLGVTSLQGRFRDRDIDLRSVEPEEEYNLTEELIKHYEMTWPVVFSERGLFDQKYGVIGVPTMVIVDRDGMAREIKTGFNPNEVDNLRRAIEKLLAE